MLNSGAHIAYCLLQNHVSNIIPKPNPTLIAIDSDWVFPNTTEGIELALSKNKSYLFSSIPFYTRTSNRNIS